MATGPRKLLVAAIGVATINYLATACGKAPTSGNLPSPQPIDAQPIPVAGNLPAPPPIDAAPPPEPPPISGNLMAPPPADAGKPKDPPKGKK